VWPFAFHARGRPVDHCPIEINLAPSSPPICSRRWPRTQPQAFDELIATIRRAEKRQGAKSFGASRPLAPSSPLPHSRMRLGPGGACLSGLVSLQSRPLPTVLAVLTVVRVGFARDALSLMIRVPARPSRPKVISIPSARRGVCARRSRPARARGDFGQPPPVRDASSPEGWAATRNRSEAFPVQMVRSAMMSRQPLPLGAKLK
jgi:hypothetical protein